MGQSRAPVVQNTEDVSKIHFAITISIARNHGRRQGVLEANIIKPQFLARDHQAINVTDDFEMANKATRNAAFHHIDGDGTQTGHE